jgi:selenocysteine lyase/cysteine desulfurase
MDISDCRTEFTLNPEISYLNHAAVAPWPSRTVIAVEQFARENARQGSRNYPAWMAIESQLREQIRQLINAPSSDDIALLKNTSEALSVVAFGLSWAPGDNIVSSNEEFPSNRIVWEALQSKGVELRQADLHGEQSAEESLFALVDGNTRMIAISSVQYASGFQLDLQRIGQFCQEHDILFCVDAIQSIGALQFDVQAINADFVMADGHKWMLGPEGLALFYCREDLREQLQLQQYGWHMTENYLDFDDRKWSPAKTARRFECGSPNMLAIHALTASLSLLLGVGMANIETAVLQNSRLLFESIAAEPRLTLITDTSPGRYGGIVTFRHQGGDQQRVYEQLMAQGVMCAQRGGGIRFSPHFYTAPEQIIRAVELAAAGK